MLTGLYIPLPDQSGRRDLVEHLLRDEQHTLGAEDITAVVELTRLTGFALFVA